MRILRCSVNTLLLAWAYGDSSVKGGRGVDLPEKKFSSCFVQIFLTVLPEFGRAVAPPPASYAYAY